MAVVLDIENSLDVLRYKGFYAHFRTRATAVPCMQNMCTCVYERSRDFIIMKERKNKME